MSLYSNPTLARLDEHFQRLSQQHGCVVLDADSFDDFINQPGEALILFADDPQRVPETWDIAVILPELIKGLANGPRVGLLPPTAAHAVSSRYGIRLWPALLALRGGAYLGVIEGLKDWGVYAAQLPQLLAAPESRPPGIGIPVQTVGASASCH
jgi:hydrogenase-1 operon protein HyaE